MKFRGKESFWFLSDLNNARATGVKGLYTLHCVSWIFRYRSAFGTSQTRAPRKDARGVFSLGGPAVNARCKSKGIFGRFLSLSSEGGCSDRNASSKSGFTEKPVFRQPSPAFLREKFHSTCPKQILLRSKQPCPLVLKVACNVQVDGDLWLLPVEHACPVPPAASCQSCFGYHPSSVGCGLGGHIS